MSFRQSRGSLDRQSATRREASEFDPMEDAQESCDALGNPGCSELIADFEATIKRFDANQDGVIDDSEVQQATVEWSEGDLSTERFDAVVCAWSKGCEVSYGGETNQPPTADFTWARSEPVAEEEVTFYGSGSFDTDGSIAKWEWDFGDGATSTGETVAHTFGSAGTYEVTLTVTDDDGATDTQTQPVTIRERETGDGGENTPPTASFTVQPEIADVGQNVRFDANRSEDPDGRVVDYDWVGADGWNGTGETATHAFGSTGDYDVTLTVLDDDGATAQSTQTVTVEEAPPDGGNGRVGDGDGRGVRDAALVGGSAALTGLAYIFRD